MSEKLWCPTCGRNTKHKKFTGVTNLLVYSGELVDGKPVHPELNSETEGCPFWKSKCVIHQSDHRFETSPECNSGKPVLRVPDGISSQSCRIPRQGEMVCCECLDAAENGVSVQDLQKELGTYRQKIYHRAVLRNIGRRYVVNTGNRPERRFTQEEAEIFRFVSKPDPEKEPEKHDDPVHCHCCGTRLS